MKRKHLIWGLLAGGLLFAVLLYTNHGCGACTERFSAMIGAWPGAGPGVSATAVGRNS